MLALVAVAVDVGLHEPPAAAAPHRREPVVAKVLVAQLTVALVPDTSVRYG